MPSSPQAFPLIALILTIAPQHMLLVFIPRQRALFPSRAVTATATAAALNVIPIELLLVITATCKRIIELATTRRALLAAARAVLLHAGRKALGLLLVEQLELVRVARRVAEALAARHEQVDAEAGAEYENERERGIDPCLGAGADAKGRKKAWKPGGAWDGGCGRVGRGLELAGIDVACGLSGPVGVIGGIAGWTAVGWGRNDAGRRGDDRGRNGGSGDHVVVVVVVFFGQGENSSFAGVDGLSPQLEVPVYPCSVEFVDLGVSDDNCPSADARFTPVFPVSMVELGRGQNNDLPVHDAHKGPVNVTRLLVVEPTRNGQVADDIVGTDEVNRQVTATSVVDVHGDGDMLHPLKVGILEHIGRHIEADSDAIVTLGDSLLHMDPWREEPGLGLDVLPRLGSLHQAVAVNLAVAIHVAELLAVKGGLPASVILVDCHSCDSVQVLHVSPSEVGSNFKDKREDTGSQGSCCGCASVGGRAGINANVRSVL